MARDGDRSLLLPRALADTILARRLLPASCLCPGQCRGTRGMLG